MPDLAIRLVVLIIVGLATWFLVIIGRRFVETRRQRALSASGTVIDSITMGNQNSSTRVYILAFSSEDCHQCHQLQTPALRRVLEARGDSISVTDVDAPSAPELTQRYQILTVPSTVVLDATGKAHAVNYGFANTQRLLQQVDAVMAQYELVTE